jgi:stress-induced morphogen
MASRDSVQQKLENSLPCLFCDVEDISDGAVKFKVKVVSPVFEGKSVIQRHRMVYDLFAEELKGPIHALSLTTLTPAQHAPNNS